MSGGNKKCRRCNTYRPSDEVCQCWEVPRGSLVIEPGHTIKLDYSLPTPEGPRLLTLPTDSQERKGYPLYRGCFQYFPAALAGVAKVSKLGNDKHNPGEDMHHARSKSTDHGDCILRHLMDLSDLLAVHRSNSDALTPKGVEDLLSEVSSLAWRALALSQELHEEFGAPKAPGAR